MLLYFLYLFNLLWFWRVLGCITLACLLPTLYIVILLWTLLPIIHVTLKLFLINFITRYAIFFHIVGKTIWNCAIFRALIRFFSLFDFFSVFFILLGFNMLFGEIFILRWIVLLITEWFIVNKIALKLVLARTSSFNSILKIITMTPLFFLVGFELVVSIWIIETTIPIATIPASLEFLLAFSWHFTSSTWWLRLCLVWRLNWGIGNLTWNWRNCSIVEFPFFWCGLHVVLIIHRFFILNLISSGRLVLLFFWRDLALVVTSSIFFTIGTRTIALFFLNVNFGHVRVEIKARLWFRVLGCIEVVWIVLSSCSWGIIILVFCGRTCLTCYQGIQLLLVAKHFPSIDVRFVVE